MKDLHDQIKYLKNEKLELNDKVHGFKNNWCCLKNDNTEMILDQHMKICFV